MIIVTIVFKGQPESHFYHVLFHDNNKNDVVLLCKWAETNCPKPNHISINIKQKDVTGDWYTSDPWFDLADIIGYTRGSYIIDCPILVNRGVGRKHSEYPKPLSVPNTVPGVTCPANLDDYNNDWSDIK